MVELIFLKCYNFLILYVLSLLVILYDCLRWYVAATYLYIILFFSSRCHWIANRATLEELAEMGGFKYKWVRAREQNCATAADKKMYIILPYFA